MRREVVIVGMGAGGATLTFEAFEAVTQADVIVGSRRMLEALPDACTSAHRAFAVTSAQIAEALGACAWNRAAVAVSGDVGLFSGARGLAESLEAAFADCSVRLVPGVSSAQLLAARLRVPWQGWRMASAHGVSCDVCALAASGEPTFLVTGGASRVQDLCARLVQAGLGEVCACAGEWLGYPEERVVRATAAELACSQFADLAVLLLNPDGPAGRAPAAAQPEAAWPYASSGIPDEEFVRADVPMTKQEVRAVALAKLRVAASDVVFDVGAGTGSVSVELARLASLGRVFAVERRPEAAALVRANAERFGVRNLSVVEGAAPEALAGLPAPDAAFVGGSGGGLARVLDALRAANPRVRVCVACVTLETLSQATALLACADAWDGFEACQVGVTRTRPVGGYHMARAENPVFLVSARGAAGHVVPFEGDAR